MTALNRANREWADGRREAMEATGDRRIEVLDRRCVGPSQAFLKALLAVDERVAGRRSGDK